MASNEEKNVFIIADSFENFYRENKNLKKNFAGTCADIIGIFVQRLFF